MTNTFSHLITSKPRHVDVLMNATWITTALTTNAHADVTVITDAGNLLKVHIRFVHETTRASLVAAWMNTVRQEKYAPLMGARAVLPAASREEIVPALAPINRLHSFLVPSHRINAMLHAGKFPQTVSPSQ
jgi:hypothetical protein